MKVLLVLGTRPEAVKLASVVRALKTRRVPTAICATGQHKELFDQNRAVLGATPRYRLTTMRRGQDPKTLSGRVQRGLKRVFAQTKPALVVVQGDTSTAAAAAVAAFEHDIPLAHVEAGLRSHDLDNPKPEEENRILIDGLSMLHFAPTQTARMNLLNEAIADDTIVVTGNTVVDALKQRGIKPGKNDGPALVTLHRRESLGAPLRAICRGIVDALDADATLAVDCLVHPNPEVRKTLRAQLRHPRANLLSPQPYPKFLRRLADCRFVLTDSGGLQEEAACLNKPVLVARDATDRPELLKTGGAWLIGRKRRPVCDALLRLSRDAALRAKMRRAKNPFGDGRAGERIAAAIERFLKKGKKDDS